MLTLYRDNSQYHRNEMYKCDIQKHGFLEEENRSDLGSCLF